MVLFAEAIVHAGGDMFVAELVPRACRLALK